MSTSDDRAAHNRLAAMFDGGDIGKSIAGLKGLPSWGSIFGDGAAPVVGTSPAEEDDEDSDSESDDEDSESDGEEPLKAPAPRGRLRRSESMTSLPSPMGVGEESMATPRRARSQEPITPRTPRAPSPLRVRALSPVAVASSRREERLSLQTPRTPAAARAKHQHARGSGSVDREGAGASAGAGIELEKGDTEGDEDFEESQDRTRSASQIPPSPGSPSGHRRRRAFSANSPSPSFEDPLSPEQEGGILSFFLNPRGGAKGARKAGRRRSYGSDGARSPHQLGLGAFPKLGDGVDVPEPPLSLGDRRRQSSDASLRRTSSGGISPFDGRMRRAFSSVSADDAGVEDGFLNGSGIAIMDGATEDDPGERPARAASAVPYGTPRHRRLSSEVDRVASARSPSFASSIGEAFGTAGDLEDFDGSGDFIRTRRAHTGSSAGRASPSSRGDRSSNASMRSGFLRPGSRGAGGAPSAARIVLGGAPTAPTANVATSVQALNASLRKSRVGANKIASTSLKDTDGESRASFKKSSPEITIPPAVPAKSPAAGGSRQAGATANGVGGASGRGVWGSGVGSGWGVLGSGRGSPSRTRKTFMEKVGDMLEAAAETAIPSSPTTLRRRRAVVGKTWEDWDVAFLEKFMSEEARVMEDRGRRDEVAEAGHDKAALIRLARLWRVPFISQIDYERQRSILRKKAIGHLNDDGRCVVRPLPAPRNDSSSGKSGPISPPRSRKPPPGRGAAKRVAKTVTAGRGPIQHAVVKRRIPQAEGTLSGSPAVLYVVEVEPQAGEGGSWVCYKRLSDFLELWQGLSQDRPDVGQFDFPKQEWMSYADRVLGGADIDESERQAKLTALLQLLLGLDPRPSELVRFLKPHAADRSTPILAASVESGLSSDEGSSVGVGGIPEVVDSGGKEDWGKIQVTRVRSGAEGKGATSRYDDRLGRGSGSAGATGLPSTPSTALFLGTVGVLQALAAAEVLGIVATLPMAAGYLWVGVAVAAVSTSVLVFLASEDDSLDRGRTVGRPNGVPPDTANYGARSAALGMKRDEEWWSGDHSSGEVSTSCSGAVGDAGIGWPWKVLAVELALGVLLAGLSAGRGDGSLCPGVPSSPETLDPDGFVAPRALAPMVGKAAVSAVLSLLCAVELVALALGYAVLPPLAAALSVTFWYGGRSREPGMEESAPTECTSASAHFLMAPSAEQELAEAGDAIPALLRDARRWGGQENPRDEAVVSLLGTVLRLVVFSGSAASAYGGTWVAVRPLAAFAIRRLVHLLSFLLVSRPLAQLERVARGGEAGVGDGFSGMQGGSHGAGTDAWSKEEGEEEEEGEVEEKGDEAGGGGRDELVSGGKTRGRARRSEEDSRGVWGKFRKRLSRVFPSPIPAPPPPPMSPELVLELLAMDGLLEAHASGSGSGEWLAATESLDEHRNWWPICVEEQSTGGAAGGVEAVGATGGAFLSIPWGRRWRQRQLAFALRGLDRAVASVYAGEDTAGVDTGRATCHDGSLLDTPPYSCFPGASSVCPRSSLLVPPEGLRLLSTADVLVGWVAVGVVWVTRRRECKATREGRSLRLLCSLGMKVLVAGYLVVGTFGWSALLRLERLPPAVLLCAVEAWRALAGLSLLALAVGLGRLSSKMRPESREGAVEVLQRMVLRRLAQWKQVRWGVMSSPAVNGSPESRSRDEADGRPSWTYSTFGQRLLASGVHATIAPRRSVDRAGDATIAAQGTVSRLLSDLSLSFHGSFHGSSHGDSRRGAGDPDPPDDDATQAPGAEGASMEDSWVLDEGVPEGKE